MKMIEKIFIDKIDQDLPSQWLPSLRHLQEEDRKNSVLAIAKFCQERVVIALNNGQIDHAANIWLNQLKQYYLQYQNLIDKPISNKIIEHDDSIQNLPSKNEERPLNPREKDSLLKIIGLTVPLLAEKIGLHRFIKSNGELNISEFAKFISKTWIKKHPRNKENMSSSNIEKKLKEALKHVQ